MGAILSYSLGGSVFLLAGYLVYKLFLSRENQTSANRLALFGIYIVAFTAIPLMSVRFFESNVRGGTIELGDIVVNVARTAAPADNLFARVMLWIYLAGVTVTMIYTLYGILRLITIVRRGQTVCEGQYRVIMLEECEVPFSFVRYIVVGKKDCGESFDMIVAHESAHLHHRHWIDLLVAQAGCILMWYNPAAWLMRDEMRQLHEYQADRSVLLSGFDPQKYQTLLINKAAGVRLQSLANSLNHSNLYKRITMMYKSENRGGRALRPLLLIPAIALAVLAVKQPAVATALSSVGSATVMAVSPSYSDDSADKVTQKDDSSQEEVASMAYKMPQFPGGEKAMLEYLVQNVVYPESAMKAGVQGKVIVKFIVGKDGQVRDPEILRSVDEALDREALRVVLTFPRFTPGYNEEGEPIAVSYALPVSFKLTGNDDATPAAAPSGNIITISGKGGSKDLSSLTYFVDDKLFSGDLSEISPDKIESITIRKDNPDYPDGAVYIYLKK